VRVAGAAGGGVELLLVRGYGLARLCPVRQVLVVQQLGPFQAGVAVHRGQPGEGPVVVHVLVGVRLTFRSRLLKSDLRDGSWATVGRLVNARSSSRRTSAAAQTTTRA
jgi:hypothetical protein